jgi:hypothetical protein
VSGAFEPLYPHLARWVQTHGYIEIGYDDYCRSFVRALDIGGMIWEGLEHYPTLAVISKPHSPRFLTAWKTPVCLACGKI